MFLEEALLGSVLANCLLNAHADAIWKVTGHQELSDLFSALYP